ncbi:MAG TPA: glycosyl hydrolase 115 family protein [Verrucomicrobiae bacterium]|nr:glycosyl hydrolase 115 family protein [Verrucomicrobiae bacterium]HZT68422.1 glycosyl hydrolase 115 family protein [Terriglobia bacterium]
MIRHLGTTVLTMGLFVTHALGQVVITRQTSVFINARESAPIQKAAQDLANDMQNVFGVPVRIVHDPAQAHSTTIWISDRFDLPARVEKPSGWEKLHIQAVEHPLPGSPAAHAIVLTGSDMRGTIYAIYQFSQQFLGVDPLYWWTDHPPQHRAEISVPDNYAETQGPVFHYRGFFINDEDLLTGWAPGKTTGISLDVWNRIYETILRLKGDMVAPGTWIFPDEPQIKLAGERGLIITQHHAIPLGLNVARWPEGVPYNYTEHPEILERAWRNAVHEYPPDVDVLWTVGLRGLSDVSYASTDPSVRGNNKALGKLISKAIARQIEIVRSVHPDAQFITNLWQEGAKLVQLGDLTIPPEVHKVWADSGYGYLLDQGEVSAGQGAYYHVAMMNGRANQLTEMVPVDRIYSELGRYIKAGATYYLLVNTSDIRPVLMTAKTVMDVGWSGVPAAGAAAANDEYRGWASSEFGPRAAAQVVDVYDDYFKAPAHFGNPPLEYGDQFYHTEARIMMLTYMIDSPLYSIPSQAPKWVQPRIFGFRFARVSRKDWLHETVEREIKQCGDAQPRWDAVWSKALAAEPLVAPDRRLFYRASVLTMIAINRQSNRALLELSRAIQLAQAGHTSAAVESTHKALLALDSIQQAEQAAEYGKWKNWYRGDWLTGIYRTKQIAEIFSKFLTDPMTHLPPPVLWDGWEAYYHIMHYEGDRTADVN